MNADMNRIVSEVMDQDCLVIGCAFPYGHAGLHVEALFYEPANDPGTWDGEVDHEEGWYWRVVPDGELSGPFEDQQGAIGNAQAEMLNDPHLWPEAEV